jgi:hypothetical protein
MMPELEVAAIPAADKVESTLSAAAIELPRMLALVSEESTVYCRLWLPPVKALLKTVTFILFPVVVEPERTMFAAKSAVTVSVGEGEPAEFTVTDGMPNCEGALK